MDDSIQQPLQQLRQIRIEKLKKLRDLGIDPYPSNANRTHTVKDIIDKYGELENEAVTVVGRLMSFRKHGALVFSDLQDASGKIQLYIKQENLDKLDKLKQTLGFAELSLLDIGDFVEATGKVVKTKRGETSVEVTELKILVKVLRPIPTKEGLQDREIRMRRRYLDTNVNRGVFERFIRRTKFWEAHREFFKQNGFLEMNIPVLEHTPGGADATPFITHMDSIKEDFYLRISQELYLKRLIGGGYEKVYEIGPRFRNEGLSDEHLPEHIAMEFYWAYADWKKGMEFVKNLFNHVIQQVYPSKSLFNIRGFDVDFSKGWEILDFGEVMSKAYGIDVYNISLKELEGLLEKYKIEKDFALNIPRGVDNLWKRVRKDIAGPAFLINHPKYLSPLQKPSIENPNIVERFQPIIAGSELGNGWSELNDPIDQFNRFNEQQKLRDQGDDEAQMMDVDFVEMLEYGMPPTFGYGHSERLFWFLEDVSAREGVPFPQLRHELEESTKQIYNIK